jgi:pSer/pThr/pTyr-binding forkhead associated (FHA) protein
LSVSDSYELVLVSGSSPGRTFPLINGENSIGRHSGNKICMSDEGLMVSKRHAMLVVGAEKLSIKDCNSTNGIFVNERKVSEADVVKGDVIGFGEKGPRLRIVEKSTDTQVASSADTVVNEAFSSASESVMQNSGIQEKVLSWKKPEDVATVEEPDESISSEGASPEEEKECGTWNTIPLPLFINNAGQHSKEMNPCGKSVSTREVEGFLSGRGAKKRRAGSASLSATQEFLLSKARKIYRKKNRVMYIVGGTVVVALCAIALYYAAGYYRYEKTFQKSVVIRNEAKVADEKFEQARSNETLTEAEKQRMLQMLRRREELLDSIMKTLPQRYRRRSYSDPVERYLHEIMMCFNEPYYRVPPHVIANVKKYVEKFKIHYQKKPYILRDWRSRYYPYIRDVFRDHHIPEVLAYIAMQESMLDTLAVSSAMARGFWQFMEGTARQYGLQVKGSRDDRTNWKMATGAAADYLHDLLAEFGEGRAVLLAIAAYNAGGAKIRTALREIPDPLRDRDFWYLYRTSNVLAEETREYVPQVLARIILDVYREEFGL